MNLLLEFIANMFYDSLGLDVHGVHPMVDLLKVSRENPTLKMSRTLFDVPNKSGWTLSGGKVSPCEIFAHGYLPYYLDGVYREVDL